MELCSWAIYMLEDVGVVGLLGLPAQQGLGEAEKNPESTVSPTSQFS